MQQSAVNLKVSLRFNYNNIMGLLRLFLKRQVLLAAFGITSGLAPLALKAQIQVNINLQPAWGPTEYDYVEYYYLPEYEVYYDVPRHQFVYFDAGRWMFGASLPSRYGAVNFYSTYKVVINEPRAYRGFKNHRHQYAGYKHGGHPQNMIRDSRSPKYSKHGESGPKHHASPSHRSSFRQPGGNTNHAPKGGGVSRKH
jgi:hypothetical protein